MGLQEINFQSRLVCNGFFGAVVFGIVLSEVLAVLPLLKNAS